MTATTERPATDTAVGVDIGLLLVRLGVGGVLLAHAAQHLFGWFNGTGIDGMARFIGQNGYPMTRPLAYVNSLSELAGGVLLVLGALTPLGAAAALGIMLNVIYIKHSSFYATSRGFEAEYMLAIAAVGLAFAGPGRFSFDKDRPWSRGMQAGVTAIVLGVVGAAITLLLKITN